MSTASSHNKVPTTFTLYSITCTVNGKIYIGVCRWKSQRFQKHFYDLANGNHGNKRLQTDYNKYGKSAFVIDVINDTFKNKYDAYFIEKYYTDVVFGLKEELCYNILSGGKNAAKGMRDRYVEILNADPIRRKQVGERLIPFNKGKAMSEETKNKIRQKRLGQKASPELRAKFSEIRSGANSSTAKEVIDTATGRIYGCLKDAARERGINYDSLRGLVNRNSNKTTLKWL